MRRVFLFSLGVGDDDETKNSSLLRFPSVPTSAFGQAQPGPTTSQLGPLFFFLFGERVHSADVKKPAENFTTTFLFTLTTTTSTAARLVLLQHHAVSLQRSIALEE